MEDEIVQMGAEDGTDFEAEMDDGDLLAGKKKGNDENGIIAILIG